VERNQQHINVKAVTQSAFP